MQCNETMQASVQAMGQIGQHMKGGKKRKKKERSLIRQTSFFGKNKGQKSKLLTQKKAELEKGERYSGYLYKRTSSGSWKKKWCVLKGCIFSYYKWVYTCTCNVGLFSGFPCFCSVVCIRYKYMFGGIIHWSGTKNPKIMGEAFERVYMQCV